jgi:8-oxo-dGTP pyrophosphatase MutT (NUDIX family)
LEYDHYNGVTVHLERLPLVLDDDDSSDNDSRLDVFREALRRQLQQWKAQGMRGVWIHVPTAKAAAVAVCVEQDFDFHMVATTTTGTKERNNHQATNVLVLSRWLPEDTPNRLPAGPNHQVGVGCLVWHPRDGPGMGARRRLLVVQEKTGPAAYYNLWKLPTGLADASEDIHEAAVRELREETGLVAAFDGLLLLRQAHPTINTSNTNTPPPLPQPSSDESKSSIKNTAVQRKASDLFFVCQMSLTPIDNSNSQHDDDDDDDDVTYWKEKFTACPDEIAAIQWMPVQEYCQQARWQGSPVYTALNQAILDAAATTSPQQQQHATTPTLWENFTLPLRHGDNDSSTNTLYKSRSYCRSMPRSA